MAQPKLSDKQLADLAALAQSATEEERKTIKEVESWVLTIGLKRGKRKVGIRALFRCYEAWAHNPINITEFTKQFNRLFRRKRREHNFYYLIDTTPLNLTDTEYSWLDEEIQCQNPKKKRKKPPVDPESSTQD